MYTYQYPMVSATVTMVVYNKDTNEILLGKRSSNSDAYPDWWGLPGGFLDARSDKSPGECAEDTCVRELMEETNIEINSKYRFILFGCGSNPDMDPRVHAIGLRYIIEVSAEEAKNAVAGDDLQELEWVNVSDRDKFMNLAFDHTNIVLDSIAFYAKIKPGRYKRFFDEETTGLAVMRLQPLHNGHCAIIDKMIKENETVIIGIGSCNQPISDKNPWSFEDRKSMVRQVYGSRVKIVPIDDLGPEEHENSWCDHVLGALAKVNAATPTTYYSGSDYDSKWYRGRFGDNIVIVDRDKNDYISGTEIRKLISKGDDSWKEYIPKVNHELIIETTKQTP